jgi:predicted transcriptional regulator with HTH domain
MAEHAAYERSIERSYLRLRVLLMLASLTEAFPRQLASACNIDCWRLNGILFGDGEDYSEDLALVRLGLVEEELTPLGRVYRITRPGARKARRMAARARRREDFRAANRAIRDMRGERAEPRVWPRVDRRDIGPVATPEVTAPPDTLSFRWQIEG